MKWDSIKPWMEEGWLLLVPTLFAAAAAAAVMVYAAIFSALPATAGQAPLS